MRIACLSLPASKTIAYTSRIDHKLDSDPRQHRCTICICSGDGWRLPEVESRFLIAAEELHVLLGTVTHLQRCFGLAARVRAEVIQNPWQLPTIFYILYNQLNFLVCFLIRLGSRGLKRQLISVDPSPTPSFDVQPPICRPPCYPPPCPRAIQPHWAMALQLLQP